MRELVLDGRRISDDGGCFVIAEIGHNHQGSVEKAKELFRAARDCGNATTPGRPTSQSG